MLKMFKTENIIKVSPDDTLSSTLKLLQSSHDSAFVFEGDTFLGCINPYYCVIKKSYPGSTKVKNCLMHPPKIDNKTPIEEIARLMIESKIYFLPVFENDEFKGIVTAYRILGALDDSALYQTKIADFVKKNINLISIDEKATAEQALAMFKNNKISKLVVTNNAQNIKGMLSYYDLIDSTIAPKERMSVGAMHGEKKGMLDIAIKKIYNPHVFTIHADKMLSDVIKIMRDHGVGSLVVTDSDHKPMSIITIKDLLAVCIRNAKKVDIQIHDENVSPKIQKKWQSFVRTLKPVVIRHNVETMIADLEEKKNGALFSAKIMIERKPSDNDGHRGHRNGLSIIVDRESKNFKELLTELKSALRSALA